MLQLRSTAPGVGGERTKKEGVSEQSPEQNQRGAKGPELWMALRTFSRGSLPLEPGVGN